MLLFQNKPISFLLEKYVALQVIFIQITIGPVLLFLILFFMFFYKVNFFNLDISLNFFLDILAQCMS